MTAKIGDITLATTAAADDLIEMERAADGLSRRISKVNFMGGTFTGGGALATGGFTLTAPATGVAALKSGSPTTGRMAQWSDANAIENSTLAKTGAGVLTLSASSAFTLTVPATGTAALLGIANVFTADQRVNALVGVNKSPSSAAQVDILSGAVGRAPLRIDTAASPTTPVAVLRVNGLTAGSIFGAGGESFNRQRIIHSDAFDNGSETGAQILVNRNNNATTPAAGNIVLAALSGAAFFVWPDSSGNLRIHTSAPTNATDTAGTVVGSQSSMAAVKDIDEALPDWRESINHIVEAVQGGALRSWRYKSGAYNDEYYPIGIVTDFATRYGQDKGRSLNIPVAIGDLMAAVVTLAERVAELEVYYRKPID